MAQVTGLEDKVRFLSIGKSGVYSVGFWKLQVGQQDGQQFALLIPHDSGFRIVRATCSWAKAEECDGNLRIADAEQQLLANVVIATRLRILHGIVL